MCFRPPSLEGEDVKCPQCGAVVPPNSTECPQCGAKEAIVGAAPPPPPGGGLKAPGAPKGPKPPGRPKPPTSA